MNIQYPVNHIILNEKNEMYVCGYNDHGQLGLGDNKSRYKYEKIDYYFGVIKNICYGYSHNIIFNEKNEIWVSGRNDTGQLGLGDNNDRKIYEKVEYNLGSIKNIYCGYFHSILLNEKNGVYVCGYNYFGQLGLGDNQTRNKYEKIDFDFGIIKNIFCGNAHNIILNEKNEIYVCGYNYRGQLGLGDFNDRNKYTKLEHNFGIIKNIFCGDSHNIILNEKNEIYVCGGNSSGQLGLSGNNKRNTYIKLEHNFGIIKNIYCSHDRNIILNENNEMFVCGNNEFGQLGLGDNKNRNIFVKLEHNFGTIKNISCCRYHNMILNEKNEIYGCGYNYYGQLGLGDNQNRNIFEKLGYNFGFEKKYDLEFKFDDNDIIIL
jgi:alpha-tubulin suppressor-like RCC1 family protein